MPMTRLRSSPGHGRNSRRWPGVSLGKLLDEAGLQPAASHLLIRSVDGFYEVVGRA
jgi:DMSO/TMAO reductase YedYZ molybdopterin-dependent catalytic subunit